MKRGRSHALSPRLMAAADLALGEEAVIDVGTDHAALPIYLAENRYVSRIIATEIGAGPMSRARCNVEKAGLREKIRLVQCDGLSAFDGSEAGCIIICGMGADTIVDILRASDFVKDLRHRLILQPMSKAEKLRLFLYREKIAICTERLISDGGRLYVCIEARGHECADNAANSIFASSRLLSDPHFPEYADRVIGRLAKIKNRPSPWDGRYEGRNVDEEIKKLTDMRTRWENCRR